MEKFKYLTVILNLNEEILSLSLYYQAFSLLIILKLLLHLLLF